MKIAVLGGAGAMGSVFGGHLAEAGNNVVLIDVWEQGIAAINAQGVHIEDKSGDARIIRVGATTDPTEIGPVDLVMVFVKCYHTETAVGAATPLIGPDTTVLTLQNGWGNASSISALVGAERVLVGLTYHSATLLEPGRAQHSGRGLTFIGELDGRISDRLRRITETFTAAGLDVTPTVNVLKEIWSKLALNVCTLPTAALLRFYAGKLVEHSGTLDLMRALLREVVAVANAQDIALGEQERWEAITGLLKRAAGAKASMLQDIEKGRRTEIDVINGAIVDAGRRLGIPTPYNNTMVWLVKSLEETF
ncbi:MAG: 2-dehydropantoate 2-reductase [Roseiflexaceae bacterium]|nr:2-dehydropantoate 2-reductase [Roseiflexaceae bacterium]